MLSSIIAKDFEHQNLWKSGDYMINWEGVLRDREFLQESFKALLKTDIKFCETENVEQHFWRILFYNVIELLRRPSTQENAPKRRMDNELTLEIIEDGTSYLESLLALLESTYDFKLNDYLSSATPPKGLGHVGLALISAQKIYLSLGDLMRYKEQTNGTTNYGKSRQ